MHFVIENNKYGSIRDVCLTVYINVYITNNISVYNIPLYNQEVIG